MSNRNHARDYGRAHRRRREILAPLVASGQVKCARCGERIEAGAPWDLDHTDDRRGYRGASHRKCNRQTEWHGVKQPRETPRDGTMLRWSRIWWEPIPDNVENRDELILAARNQNP